MINYLFEKVIIVMGVVGGFGCFVSEKVVFMGVKFVCVDVNGDGFIEIV